MTLLHYVCRSPFDARELSQPTIDAQKAQRDLAKLRREYSCCVIATICVDDDEPEAELEAA